MNEQPILFEERFLEKYVGTKLLSDPVTAVIELIANSWDASATEVYIQWPDERGDDFTILDNGCGILEDEFIKIWSTMAYDRTKTNGKYASDNGLQLKRIAFGRNGIGRFAGFCFAQDYYVSSKTKNGDRFNYIVTSKVEGKPLALIKDSSSFRLKNNGMKITIKNANVHGRTLEEIRSEIGMRFFSNDNFKVYVQNKLVTFDDISSQNISEEFLSIGENIVRIIIIDTVDTDRSTKHHGIAWKVNNRLVGDITWEGLSNQYNVDGRRMESRRYSFIVIVDFLRNYVLPDWSGFEEDKSIVFDTLSAVYKFIWNKIIDLSKDQREASLNRIKQSLNTEIKKMSPLKKEKWEQFIKAVQEKCPSLNEPELSTLGSVLANLELSQDKYDLLNQLNDLSPDRLDDLNAILQKWSVEYAKVILDEIENRLSLLKQLEQKLYAKKADEVHELQPLFEKGLWIFGPEFESIEYTSNKGMTTVIQDLFGDTMKASLNRPDFVIRTDSSVGLYSRPSYDDEGFEEIGVERLIIIELKAPGVKLRDDEINQPKKYADELFSKGLLQNNTSKVTCFVIGGSITEGQEGEVTTRNGAVKIRPIVYDIVIRRAKSRLFNLYDKIKEAPFMKDIDKSYTTEIEETRMSLF
ncbi:MAG: ATP-binding protein [Treponema sp.]|jgi:hypothetical protein|nr:ATP-binding protein [Treponema sp.]